MAVNREMTPTGRQATDWGNPPGRPPGPTQHLIPVGPPPTYAGQPIGGPEQPPVMVDPRTGRKFTPSGRIAPTSSPTAHQNLVGLPRLDSPFINPGTAQTTIPWTQFITNLWRLAQPTGIIPGTFAGITFNVFGQAISAQSSGFTLDSPVLTGNPTAPTPPANDNSTRIATTAFVKEQGYITGVALGGDVTGSGGASVSTTVVGLQGHPVSAAAPTVGQLLEWNGSAWAPYTPPFLTDAPSDGNLYARQNGQWVRLSQSVIPPV